MNDPATNPEAKALATEAETLLTTAQSYQITTPEQYTGAGEWLKQVKGKSRALEEQRKAMTRPLDEAKQQIMDFFRTPLAKLEQAEGIVKKAMLGYQEKEQERIRAERAAAEAAARKERERIEAQERAAREKAEADRRAAAEAEQRAAAARAAGDAEAAAAAQAEADRKAAAAARAEQKADDKAAVASTVVAVAVDAAPTRVAGIATRENWKAEVTDMRALVQAVAEGRASIELLEPNTTEIGKRARALKGEFVVPGVRVWPEKVMAA